MAAERGNLLTQRMHGPLDGLHDARIVGAKSPVLPEREGGVFQLSRENRPQEFHAAIALTLGIRGNRPELKRSVQRIPPGA
jgi:hypothetical protein